MESGNLLELDALAPFPTELVVPLLFRVDPPPAALVDPPPAALVDPPPAALVDPPPAACVRPVYTGELLFHDERV